MSRVERLLSALRAEHQVDNSYPDRREAAVAVILVPDPDRVLLIARAIRAGDPWSGQLALPGGHRQSGDADLLDTAIRETVEETAVVLSRNGDLARLIDLAPVSPTLPAICVRPFLFVLEDEPVVHPNAEVAGYSWVGLAQLLVDGALVAAEVELPGRRLGVMGYRLPAGLLWGMTERILTPVVARWGEFGGVQEEQQLRESPGS